MRYLYPEFLEFELIQDERYLSFEIFFQAAAINAASSDFRSWKGSGMEVASYNHAEITSNCIYLNGGGKNRISGAAYSSEESARIQAVRIVRVLDDFAKAHGFELAGRKPEQVQLELWD